jgi:hypothetical protein
MITLRSWQNAIVLLISEKQHFAFMPVYSKTVHMSIKSIFGSLMRIKI